LDQLSNGFFFWQKRKTIELYRKNAINPFQSCFAKILAKDRTLVGGKTIVLCECKGLGTFAPFLWIMNAYKYKDHN